MSFCLVLFDITDKTSIGQIFVFGPADLCLKFMVLVPSIRFPILCVSCPISLAKEFSRVFYLHLLLGGGILGIDRLWDEWRHWLLWLLCSLLH